MSPVISVMPILRRECPVMLVDEVMSVLPVQPVPAVLGIRGALDRCRLACGSSNDASELE
jgi:hypothetical protein